MPEKVGTILSTLDSAFNWNLLLLVHELVVLVGSVMKLPTVPVMLVSCATAIFNAVVFQGVSFSNSVAASVNGFKVDMVAKSGFQGNCVQLFREDRVPPVDEAKVSSCGHTCSSGALIDLNMADQPVKALTHPAPCRVQYCQATKG